MPSASRSAANRPHPFPPERSLALSHPIALPHPNLPLTSDSATIVGWQRESLYTPWLATTGGIERFSGTAIVDGHATPWSVVRKLVIAPANATDDPTSRAYW